MGNNFEFDKLVWAVALAIFTLVLSINLGGFLYRVEKIPAKKGINIEIVEAADSSGGAPKGLPDVIEIGKIMAAASAEAGKQVFNKCAVCHTIAKGEPNKVGPNLWGIVGSKVARHEDFKYSDAMHKRGADGKVWDYEELYRYLFAPRTYVAGTKMAFAGLKKDEERANLIAYLRSMADSPLPLPPAEAAKK